MKPRTKFVPKARNFFYETNNIPGKINKKNNRDKKRDKERSDREDISYFHFYEFYSGS